METRRAEYSDAPELSILFDNYRQFYGQEPDLDGAKSFIQERLSIGDSTVFVAVSDASLAGFVQLYPSFSSVSMKRIYILNDLFVYVGFRKQGVGASLIRAAEMFATERQAPRLTLATEVSNGIARSLYESLGWQEDKRFIHYNRNMSN